MNATDTYTTGTTLTWAPENEAPTTITKVDENFWEIGDTGRRTVWNWLNAFGTVSN